MSKIIIFKKKRKDLPKASYHDSSVNIVQQAVLKGFKNKLILLANEVTDALDDLYEEEKIIDKAIKDKEKKNDVGKN